jgi:ribosomal-protein-alanine N-acetyltransferase
MQGRLLKMLRSCYNVFGMFPDRRMTTRPAVPADRNAIMALMRYEPHVHSHLDWKPAEEWLGTQPYLVAERGKRVIGAIACPPDPPDAAWLRLFTAVGDSAPTAVWELLWPAARAALTETKVQIAAALGLEEWFGPLCLMAGFRQSHSVVVLSRHRAPLEPPLGPPPQVQVREARRSDYDDIAATDLAAFTPPWQMSAKLMSQAIPLADFITVAEIDHQIVGYQLTTPSHQGAHLARLAVLPGWQGNGIGQALVRHLIEYYNRRGIRELTVNTQDTNAASLGVYHNLGFVKTGASYPVYQYNLSEAGHE